MRPRFAAFPAALAFLASALPATASGLEPYLLIRSLQLVQDRIADGDHAALPMQRKILEMIDARLAASTPEEFSDGRNFRALMVYAMSGGNPATVNRIVSGLILEEKDARLGAGLVQYTRGDMGRAAAALKDLEPREVPADISPILALMKGTMLANQEPERGLHYLDYARLVGPGTLIEEAALRRSISLTVELKDDDRFLRASEQYVRRFPRSPYASQFADAFVAGVVGLHETIDLEQVVEIIGEMTPEQGKVIYLRIARQAAIDRLEELLAFATSGLETSIPGSAGGDPRAALYSALAMVASEDVMQVRERLALIDPSQLSGSDRVLLDAARALVEEVVSLPPTSSIAATGAEGDNLGAAQPPPSQAGPSGQGAADAPPAERVAEAPVLEAAVEREPDPSKNFITETRRRIEAIDKLLEENRP